jgi:hypothetical protein
VDTPLILSVPLAVRVQALEVESIFIMAMCRNVPFVTGRSSSIAPVVALQRTTEDVTVQGELERVWPVLENTNVPAPVIANLIRSDPVLALQRRSLPYRRRPRMRCLVPVSCRIRKCVCCACCHARDQHAKCGASQNANCVRSSQVPKP